MIKFFEMYCVKDDVTGCINLPFCAANAADCVRAIKKLNIDFNDFSIKHLGSYDSDHGCLIINELADFVPVVVFIKGEEGVENEAAH